MIRLAQLVPKNLDWIVLSIPLLLTAAGIAVIASIGAEGQVALAVTQGVYAAVAIAVMVGLTLLDYRTFRASAPAIFAIGLVLLVLVTIIGTEQFGARRWIDLGPMQVQPSELMKLIILITLAWFFARREEVKAADVVAAILLLLLPSILVIRQPDFGTAMLLVFGTAPIFLLSRMTREQWIGIALVMLITIPILFFSLKPYQRQRLEAFLDPGQDPFGAGYNVLQSEVAIGSGGLTGRGLGQGSQSTLEFVPVAHTDFIFAGVAEATGFLGSFALLGLFAVLIVRAFRISTMAQDRFGRLLAAGIASLWLFSVFINVGMNLGVAPATGIPLPFVSFGGSSLVTNFAMVGILESIAARHKKIRFD